MRYYAYDSGQANYSFLPLNPEIFPLKMINIIFFSFHVFYTVQTALFVTQCVCVCIYIYIERERERES